MSGIFNAENAKDAEKRRGFFWCIISVFTLRSFAPSAISALRPVIVQTTANFNLAGKEIPRV